MTDDGSRRGADDRAYPATIELPTSFVEAVADAVAERLLARLGGDSLDRSPWKTTTEAIEYTRLPEGTFRKLAAAGRIPSHGGRRKLFHVAELDRALGYADAAPPRAQIRRADAA